MQLAIRDSGAKSLQDHPGSLEKGFALPILATRVTSIERDELHGNGIMDQTEARPESRQCFVTRVKS